MWFLIVTGLIALLAGILFLFSPQTLRKINDKVNVKINKVTIPIDEKVYKLNTGVGISLILVAGLLFFFVYYLSKKYF